jgi:prepilin-type N-terminal cleavage/methylation domain-containing protein
MKTTQQRNPRSGFTLIEMVGVLAVIAILAALLVPKIFAAINESRLNNCVGSINACKTAAMNYFAKYGRFGDATGAPYTDTALTTAIDWSPVLVSTGFMEKAFASRVGDSSTSGLFVQAAVDEDANTSNIQFDLDGAGSAKDIPTGSAVLYVKLTNVAIDDARELSQRIDGEGTLSPTTGNDTAGRVKFANGNTTTVYVYLAHK